MAKTIANCTCATCGTVFIVPRFGSNRRDADQSAAWAEAHFDECPDCYKKRMAQEREKANTQAAEQSAEMGLPDLVGSPKQIAWATTIRYGFLAEYYPLDKLKESGKAFLAQWLSDHTEARFWIDKRNFLNLVSIEIDQLYSDSLES